MNGDLAGVKMAKEEQPEEVKCKRKNAGKGK